MLLGIENFGKFYYTNLTRCSLKNVINHVESRITSSIYSSCVHRYKILVKVFLLNNVNSFLSGLFHLLIQYIIYSY